jgi:hypothetical protein
MKTQFVCVTCGAPAEMSPIGPRAWGVCRDPYDPNQQDQGQHVINTVPFDIVAAGAPLTVAA